MLFADIPEFNVVCLGPLSIDYNVEQKLKSAYVCMRVYDSTNVGGLDFLACCRARKLSKTVL